MENGFVKIPRAWFTSDAWRKANDKQKVAMVTLCSVVAYGEYVFESKYGNVKLECGQMVTSINMLMDLLQFTRKEVRNFLEYLENKGVINIEVAYSGTGAHKRAHYSILTINDLHTVPTQNGAQKRAQKRAQDIEIIKENNIKKEIIKKEVQHRFVPPTAEEVQAYLDEKGITSFTGADFVAYYEQGGWVYGKSHTPVKNWKACVSTWMRFGNQTTNYGNTKTDIYCNGYAGREERQRIFEQHIIEQLTKPHIEPELPF